MVKPLPRGGGGTGRLTLMLFALLLSGCARGGSSYSQLPPPGYYNHDYYDSHVHVPMTAGLGFGDGKIRDPATIPDSYRPAALEQGSGEGCSIGNRFDRRTTLAYNFDDHQSQLGFRMAINSRNNGPVGVSRAMLVFRYKFQPAKERHERCRYNSHWQGVVGSAYNELILREHNSLWGEIRDRGLDFWNR
jgi:hypothetical protein